MIYYTIIYLQPNSWGFPAISCPVWPVGFAVLSTALGCCPKDKGRRGMNDFDPTETTISLSVERASSSLRLREVRACVCVCVFHVRWQGQVTDKCWPCLSYLISPYTPTDFFNITLPDAKGPPFFCKRWPPPKSNKGKYSTSSSLYKGSPLSELHVSKDYKYVITNFAWSAVSRTVLAFHIAVSRDDLCLY